MKIFRVLYEKKNRLCKAYVKGKNELEVINKVLGTNYIDINLACVADNLVAIAIVKFL
jgi:hypothetical protein